MVDEWEAAQPGYSRTLVVMRRVRLALEDMFSAGVPASSTHSDGAHAERAPAVEGTLHESPQGMIGPTFPLHQHKHGCRLVGACSGAAADDSYTADAADFPGAVSELVTSPAEATRPAAATATGGTLATAAALPLVDSAGACPAAADHLRLPDSTGMSLRPLLALPEDRSRLRIGLAMYTVIDDYRCCSTLGRFFF